MRPVPLRIPRTWRDQQRQQREIQIDSGIALLRLPATLAAADERVHRSDGAKQAVVLEVFCDNFRQAVIFCIRPEVRIEPAELVRPTSSDRIADDDSFG
jgi:hypothetical protein